MVEESTEKLDIIDIKMFGVNFWKNGVVSNRNKEDWSENSERENQKYVLGYVNFE